MFSQKVENKKMEITKTKLLEVKVLSELITDLPKSETIVSYEMVYKSSGKIISVAKKGDESIKKIIETIDAKSSIYLDLNLKTQKKRLKAIYILFSCNHKLKSILNKKPQTHKFGVLFVKVLLVLLKNINHA